MLALTFDDGPDPRGTPAVLDALARAGVTATFFVLGGQVERHPGLLARTLAEGHDVQVHGHDHLRHTEHPPATVEADLERALATLRAIGVAPTRWRTPWGVLAPFTEALAARHGLTLTGWDLDTHDWRGDTPQAMLAALEARLHPGGVVLAHDGIGVGARRETAQATADLVGPLVAAARARDLLPGPLAPAWPVRIALGNPDRVAGVGRPA
jgi:peptidoglycan/xylan/chitin deacetylase (PgdA/CDA1 family)